MINEDRKQEAMIPVTVREKRTKRPPVKVREIFERHGTWWIVCLVPWGIATGRRPERVGWRGAVRRNQIQKAREQARGGR